MIARQLYALCAVATMCLIGCSDLSPAIGGRHVPNEELDSSTSPQGDATAGDGGAVTLTGVRFGRDIRPLMNRSKDSPVAKGCKDCHYSTESSHIGLDLGGLDLSSLKTLRQGGGSSGKRVLVPGKPAESAIVQKLRGTYPYGTRMPKSGPPFWTNEEIQLLSDWIEQGAMGEDDE